MYVPTESMRNFLSFLISYIYYTYRVYIENRFKLRPLYNTSKKNEKLKIQKRTRTRNNKMCLLCVRA